MAFNHTLHIRFAKCAPCACSSYGKSELAAVLSRTQRRTVFWSARISLSGGESFGCTMTAELDGNVFFCAVHKPSCAGELFPNYTDGNKIAHIDMASLPGKLLSGGPTLLKIGCWSNTRHPLQVSRGAGTTLQGC